MAGSVVWVSQKITAEYLGVHKLNSYLQALNYGNMDIAGDPGQDNGLTRCWLSSSLKISVSEQAQWIKALYHNQLPFSKRAQQLTKEIMYIRDLKNTWKLFGKTGVDFQTNSQGEVLQDRPFGWFVGWIDNGRQQCFVVNFIQETEEKTHPVSPMAREEAIQLLKPYIN